MSDIINKKSDELVKEIKIARGILTAEKIREIEEAEDGIMRIVE